MELRSLRNNTSPASAALAPGRRREAAAKLRRLEAGARRLEHFDARLALAKQLNAVAPDAQADAVLGNAREVRQTLLDGLVSADAKTRAQSRRALTRTLERSVEGVIAGATRDERPLAVQAALQGAQGSLSVVSPNTSFSAAYGEARRALKALDPQHPQYASIQSSLTRLKERADEARRSLRQGRNTDKKQEKVDDVLRKAANSCASLTHLMRAMQPEPLPKPLTRHEEAVRDLAHTDRALRELASHLETMPGFENLAPALEVRRRRIASEAERHINAEKGGRHEATQRLAELKAQMTNLVAFAREFPAKLHTPLVAFLLKEKVLKPEAVENLRRKMISDATVLIAADGGSHRIGDLDEQLLGLSISSISGVGGAAASLLGERGLRTVGDLVGGSDLSLKPGGHLTSQASATLRVAKTALGLRVVSDGVE